LRGLHSVSPLLRFLHAHVRVKIDSDADLTDYRPIPVNVNDSCRKTILSGLLSAHFFRNFDEYLHKLAHAWRDIRRKVSSQHGDVYCLARPVGTRFSNAANPHGDLKTYA